MLNTSFPSWPSFTEEEAEAVKRVLLSNKVNYWTGNECREFEKEFAAWVGTGYAIALANGTAALDAALKALDVGAGDEVIVTSRTFLASVSSIVMAGATPVFVDVDMDTQNISVGSIASAITSRTKAIICVHLAGWPCEMPAIMSLAERYKLVVIEDCAQAHGAQYEGRSIGSFGHISAWSFCQDKIMTTGGEGGMVTTNDISLWEKVWSFKDHGKSYDAVYKKDNSVGFRWLHESFGTNLRMTEMQAVIGRIQLQRMKDWHEKRLYNARQIWDFSKTLEGFRVPNIPKIVEHGAYKCYIFLRPEYLKAGWNRDRIIKEIFTRNVPCYQGSCSEVYLEKAFEGTNFRPIERLPIAKQLGETSLMFLVHPTLTSKEIKKTCDIIEEIYYLSHDIA